LAHPAVGRVAEEPATSETTPPPEDELWAKIGDPLLPSCIYVAARFRIGQTTTDRPASVEELAHAAGVNPRVLLGVLHTLAREGFFEEDDGGRFRLSPLGLRLADAETRDRILDRFEVELPYLRALDRALLSSRPVFEEVHGQGFYRFLGSQSRYADGFHRTLARGAREAVAPLLDAVDFRRFRSVLDVGGGSGALLAGVLAQVPGLRGAVLDSSQILERASEELARAGVGDRCELIAGNFLEQVPGGFDLYLLRWVLTDWDDEHAGTILRNCRQAMSPDSRLIILEPIRDVEREVVYRRNVDFVLRLSFAGGLRSRSELEELLGRAGLRYVSSRPAAWYYDATEAAPVTP
jgi:SAM-dependent methyltransferase